MVGITGGIGAGKSAVCSLLKRKGRMIISADGIANELTTKHPGLRRRLIDTFGKDIYSVDGSLDRKKFSTILFRNRTSLRKANRIIHPYVLREISRRIGRLSGRRKCPYVVVEAALVYEAGLGEYFDFVVLVDAPLAQRVGRVRKIGRLNGAEIRRRAGNQLSSREKRGRADFCIDNQGSRADLRKAVGLLDRLLKTLAK